MPLFRDQAQQVPAIGILGERFRKLLERRTIDPAMPERDLLGARDLQALPVLQRGNDLARLELGLLRAGVQPRKAPPHGLHVDGAALEIEPVQIRDLKLPARRWLE